MITFFFFFNDTATTEIYTLSLHDALPICALDRGRHIERQRGCAARERDGQAHPLGPQDESRCNHQPTHLSAGTDLDREDMDGVDILGVPQGQDARLAAPGADRKSTRLNSSHL